MFTITTTSTHPVNHIVFEPNGSSYAVVQPNFGITLLERGTNQPTGTLAVPRVADYSSVLFCDGGAKLAAASNKGVHLFDLARPAPHKRYRGENHANALLGERNGELLAANNAGVRKLNPPLASMPWGTSVPLDLGFLVTRVHALSPNGRWLVARLTGPGSPNLIDLDAWAVVAALRHPAPEHDRIRLTACFAPNSERFAVCDGQDVSVYEVGEADTATQQGTPLVQRAGRKAAAPPPRVVAKPVFKLLRPEGVQPKDHWQPPIAFTPDGRGLLVRRPRNRVQLWDVATGSHVGEWSWRMDGLMCLAIAPDGLTAVAGARFGHLVVWDLE